MSLENANITKIETVKVIKSIWVAKTTVFIPNKVEIEMKGESEINAYEKLINFLHSKQKPTRIIESPNGNKIYHFKKPAKNEESKTV
jgi:hypothetical protein